MTNRRARTIAVLCLLIAGVSSWLLSSSEEPDPGHVRIDQAHDDYRSQRSS